MTVWGRPETMVAGNDVPPRKKTIRRSSGCIYGGFQCGYSTCMLNCSRGRYFIERVLRRSYANKRRAASPRKDV